MAERARITVIAGVNGAGKSSVAGAFVRQGGGEYFNPDEVSRRLEASSPLLTRAELNGLAWEEGRKRLSEAIRDRDDFTFETTLGGATITTLLLEALDQGLEVAMLYVGLKSVELHLARVRSRANAGGHDIPEAKVRERYQTSRENLVRLALRLSKLRLFDNSVEEDPKLGRRPLPEELLYAEAGRPIRCCELSMCPEWAKPVLALFLRGD